MIVVENKLAQAFDTLPNIGTNPNADPPAIGFKPVYRWGNEHHLLKLIELFQKDQTTPYPLIYQVSNTSRPNIQRKNVEVDLQLILAVQSLDTSLLNENRWAMNYKDVLFPLAENIRKLFFKSQMFLWDGEYELLEFPNYGNGKENFTIDKWDALRFDTTITITNNCLNKIYF